MKTTQEKYEFLIKKFDDLKNTDSDTARAEALIDAISQERTTDHKLAKMLIDTCESFTLERGLELQYARLLGQKAFFYSIDGKDEEYIKTYIEIKKIYEQQIANSEDSTFSEKMKKNIGVCYNNIANVYRKVDQDRQALSFYFKALKLRNIDLDPLGFSIGYYNIGETYSELEQYDSALYYMNLSKDLEEQMESQEGMAYAYYGLGSIYYSMQDYIKSSENLIYALYNIREIEDRYFEVECLDLIGRNFGDQNNFEGSIKYFEQAFELAEEIKMLDYIPSGMLNLATANSQAGNYEQAYKYLNDYKILDDSLDQVEQENILAEFRTEYETEQKDAQIAILNEQNEIISEREEALKAQKKAEGERNRIINYALIVGILLLIIIGLVLYRGLAQKRKSNQILEEKNLDLEKKNNQIRQQSSKIQEQTAQIMDSINYAENIQLSILPPKEELDKALWNHFEYYRPKDVVSGDFYWMVSLPNENLIFYAVADCTGHGVPGAFMSLLGHALLDKVVKQLGLRETDEILKQLSLELYEKLRKNSKTDARDGMDIALVRIDNNSKSVQFTGARNSLIHVSEGILQEFKGDRADIGKVETNNKLTKSDIQYKEGDSFYMFTDGYPDQIGGPNRKKFYMKPLRDLLLKISNSSNEEAILELEGEFLKWKGDHEQIDDVLIVRFQLG